MGHLWVFGRFLGFRQFCVWIPAWIAGGLAFGLAGILVNWRRKNYLQLFINFICAASPGCLSCPVLKYLIEHLNIILINFASLPLLALFAFGQLIGGCGYLPGHWTLAIQYTIATTMHNLFSGLLRCGRLQMVYIVCAICYMGMESCQEDDDDWRTRVQYNHYDTTANFNKEIFWLVDQSERHSTWLNSHQIVSNSVRVCVCFFPTMQAACCILLNYFTQFLFFAPNLLARKAVGMRCLLAGECRETCN